MKTHLFVYGTLKRGFGNHRLLEDQEFIGEAKTWNKYIMLRHGIPYVYEEGKAYVGEVGYPVQLIEGSMIEGEFYKVDDEALARIDRLEGHPRWYCRKQINIRVDIGNDYPMTTKAWIYFMKKEREKTFKGYPWFTSRANIVSSYN